MAFSRKSLFLRANSIIWRRDLRSHCDPAEEWGKPFGLERLDLRTSSEPQSNSSPTGLTAERQSLIIESMFMASSIEIAA